MEWCNDRYHPDGYGVGHLTDPVNGIEDPSDLTPNTPVYEGMVDGKSLAHGFPAERILRGGSYSAHGILSGAGKRWRGDRSVYSHGMRIARTLVL